MSRPTSVSRRSSGSVFPLLGTVLVVLAGCSSGSGGSFGGGSVDDRPRSSRDVITQEELTQRPSDNAYDVIRQIRPQWLRARPSSSFLNPAANLPYVFVDERRFGPIDSLYQLRSANIERIELMNARDATTLYGAGFPGGIIQVYTKRGG